MRMYVHEFCHSFSIQTINRRLGKPHWSCREDPPSVPHYSTTVRSACFHFTSFNTSTVSDCTPPVIPFKWLKIILTIAKIKPQEVNGLKCLVTDFIVSGVLESSSTMIRKKTHSSQLRVKHLQSFFFRHVWGSLLLVSIFYVHSCYIQLEKNYKFTLFRYNFT